MRRFFKNLIQNYIDKAKGEREGILTMLEVCKEGSFQYNIINHSGGFLNFKILVWGRILKWF